MNNLRVLTCVRNDSLFYCVKGGEGKMREVVYFQGHSLKLLNMRSKCGQLFKE